MKRFTALAILCSILAAPPALAKNGAAADVCKTKMFLAGGYETQGATQTVLRADPIGVAYQGQWSYMTIVGVSPTLDRVTVDVNLSWTSIATRGQGIVFIGGAGPSVGVSSGFSNGSGNFGGIILPAGFTQASIDADFVTGPLGLLFIAISTPEGGDATNLPWTSMLTSPLGKHPMRVRMGYSYLTTDDAMLAWETSSPTTGLVCEIHTVKR
jgi:hypothetical protein